MAQIPHILLTDGSRSSQMLLTNMAFIALGLCIIYGLPRITESVPSPLVAIVALDGVTVAFGIDLPTVGDMGELPDTLPWVALPAVP